MDPADELREARLRAGLTIRALAQRACTAPSTVWRIEHGALSPTVRTLNRLLDAARSAMTAPRSTREQVVSLTLGRLAASSLLARPDETLARARARVEAQLADPSVPASARATLGAWSELLDGPLEEVVLALIEPSEQAHELRALLPIVGTHTDSERLDAIRRSRHAA